MRVHCAHKPKPVLETGRHDNAPRVSLNDERKQTGKIRWGWSGLREVDLNSIGNVRQLNNRCAALDLRDGSSGLFEFEPGCERSDATAKAGIGRRFLNGYLILLLA